MNDRAINHIDLQCLSCGSNLTENDLHADTVANSSCKLFYVHKGSCIIIIDGLSHFVDEDCSAVVFPFQQYHIEKAEKLKFYWIEFTGFLAPSIISRTAFSCNSPVVGKMMRPRLYELFEYPNCTGKQLYNQYRNGAIIMMIFSYYLQYFPNKRTHENDYVYSARTYIEAEFHNPEFNVSKLADHLKIDRSHLYRVFKSETGLSPMEYINRRRISEAEVLMVNRRMSIKDVAFSVGYTDQLYFSRVFKRLSGRTPTEFRRANREWHQYDSQNTAP